MKYIGFTPHPKQRDIINSIINTDIKYHIVSVGRQFGKSLMGENVLLWWAINQPKSKILWVSPIFAQSDKVHSEIETAIYNSGIIKSSNHSKNQLILNNGSEIYFKSAENYQTIRGYSFNYVIIDECAYIDENAWTQSIRPTMASQGKKALFLSTPKSKNWFYNLFQMGLSSEYPNYKSYRGSSYDSPYINQEEIEDAKKTIPENVFRQEYLAEFIEGGGEVFSNLNSITFEHYPTPMGKIYGGLDLAKQVDYSVLTLMDEQGNIIDITRTNQRDWKSIIDLVANKINQYQASVYIETNSIGDMFFDMIQKQSKNVFPFYTTNQSKQEIIEGLILDINEGNIRIPSKDLFPPLFEELSIFTYDYSPKTRSIKYGSPNGFHDDCVMSLALCNYSKKQNKSKGQYSYLTR
jgi:hypothetical protein